MGGEIVCDKVGLHMMLTSNLSHENTQSSLVDETPGRVFTAIGFLLEVLSRRIMGSSEKSSCCISQVFLG